VTSLDTPRRGRDRDRSRRELQAEWEDRELMHAVLKNQFGNGAAIRVGAVFERHVLEEVAAEVARRVQNIPRGRQFMEHRRARFLVEAVKQIVRQGSDRAREKLLAEARELAGIEVRFLSRMGKDVLGVSFRTPAPALVEAAITRQPMLGRTFGEWFEDWIPRATEARIVGRVRAGMIAGESTPQIIRSLQGTPALRHADGKLVESRRAVTMLTRTTMTHTSSAARNLTFERNTDVVTRVRWISTLDLRTSVICASLDGKTWASDEPHPSPPQHPNCRSTLAPAIGPQIGKRAALGERVDAQTSFKDWLRTRSPADQDAVLGKTKAAAWRAGRLRIDDMVDAALTRTLTLDELARAQKI
jgi:SPP1 gp7 family putative phage head morphogenesis protein